ncbi:MAG: asparaginase [Candidatus Kerfeldbacteria bacterium]|nr:asparaginase [Candidatus Kerfeldbacteria bacterium]
MATLPRKLVLLLFLGGSTISERGRAGETVAKAKDIDPWMRQMSEMDIIADTKGVFISSGTSTIGLPEWVNVAETIRQHYADIDGVVVIHQIETIRAAAMALSLMFHHLGKPIVLVGSPLLSPAERAAGLTGNRALTGGEAAAKASFINAVQVAVSDVGEVVVIFGSHMYRGLSLARDPEGPTGKLTGVILGKIDFGIRFFGQQIRRSSQQLRVRSKFDSKVTVVEYLPGTDLNHLVSMARGAHGVFLSSPEPGAIAMPMITRLAATLGSKIPIVLYMPGSKFLATAANVIPASGPTRTATLLRFMWALGQGSSMVEYRKLMRQPKGGSV